VKAQLLMQTTSALHAANQCCVAQTAATCERKQETAPTIKPETVINCRSVLRNACTSIHGKLTDVKNKNMEHAESDVHIKSLICLLNGTTVLQAHAVHTSPDYIPQNSSVNCALMSASKLRT
jgi:hypothetical protein